MTAVLAVLRPEHMSILDPDVCGGRAPALYMGYHPLIGLTNWQASPDGAYPNGALVIFDSRDPAIGRRGLAAAADAAARALGWPVQTCSPAWTVLLRENIEVLLASVGGHASPRPSHRTWCELIPGDLIEDDHAHYEALPILATIADRYFADRAVGDVTLAVPARAVGAVLVQLGISERIEEVSGG